MTLLDKSLQLTDVQKAFSAGSASAQAAFQSSVSGAGVVVPVPAALGWDQAAYPLTITLYRYRDGSSYGTSGLDLDVLVPGWKSWPQLWVDVSQGTNGSGTQASPYNSIAEAVTAANTAAVPTRIMCKGGTTAIRNRNFSASGSVIPAVDLAFVAYGGRCIVGAHDAFTWTANATYAWVYQTSRTNASRVVDLLGRDDLGLYPSLRKVSSLIECSRNPGSWYTDGTIVYVYRADGAAVADANTRLFIATENLRLSGTNQYHCLLVGETGNDGFDLEGGAAGAWRTTYTGRANNRRVIHHAKNCTFRYSGHTAGAAGNVAFEGLHGLAWFVQCDASGGATDCWNWHDVVAGTQSYIVTENCTGYLANCINGPYVSCNGWTNHDNVIAVDIAGKYYRNAGVSFHTINTSRTFAAGTEIGGSLGDRHNGGGNFPAELKAEDTAQIWTYGVTTANAFGAPKWRSEDTGAIRRHVNDWPVPAYVAPGATMGTWSA